MKVGAVILLPFPFAELTRRKVRPAIVVCETRDKYKDLVVCAVSSVVPNDLSENELLINLTGKIIYARFPSSKLTES